VDLDSELLDLVEYLKRYQLETYILDCTGDLGIPSVIAITLDRSGLGPAVNVGTRASGTYRDAARGALLESIHCRRTMRLTKEVDGRHEIIADDEVTSLDERFYYWYPPDRIDDLAFWVEGKLTVPYSDLASIHVSMDSAIERIRNRGYHLFVADLTLPEMRVQGLETLKVVIPEFHPLYLDERAKSLYSARHGEIADDATLKPHPFT
jgi:ribosomal protein S12 methylthiotransferase accessory factor